MAYYVPPHLGGLRLRDLTAGDVVRLYAELRANGRRRGPGGLSESSLTKAHVALTKALGDAVERAYWPAPPWPACRSGFGRPRSAPRRCRCGAPRRWGAFSTTLRGTVSTACSRLVLATGLRRPETAGLRSEDVDLDAGRLAVRRGRVSVGYAVEEGTPKANRARTIGLGPETVSALRAHRRRQLEERMAWGEAWIDSGLVFTGEDGTALHPQTLRWHLRRLAKEAGMPVIRFHDLRHCAATHALAGGVPVKVVSQMLGHVPPGSPRTSTPTCSSTCRTAPPLSWTPFSVIALTIC